MGGCGAAHPEHRGTRDLHHDNRQRLQRCGEDVASTQRDKIGFNLAYIGSDFTKESPKPFDQEYMRALFDYGYRRAKRGYDWAHKLTIV
jgi:hypothetical protein